MDADKVANEEDVFDLQIGLGQTQVADEDKTLRSYQNIFLL